MDFIEQIGGAESWLGTLGFLSLIGGLLLFGSIMWDAFRTMILGVILMVFGAGLLIYGSYLNSSSKVERDEKALQSIEESYGLKLTDEQFDSLEYPDSKPVGDSERFGSYVDLVRIDGGFESREIYLVWDKDQLILTELISSDQLTELKKVR